MSHARRFLAVLLLALFLVPHSPVQAANTSDTYSVEVTSVSPSRLGFSYANLPTNAQIALFDYYTGERSDAIGSAIVHQGPESGRFYFDLPKSLSEKDGKLYRLRAFDYSQSRNVYDESAPFQLGGFASDAPNCSISSSRYVVESGSPFTVSWRSNDAVSAYTSIGFPQDKSLPKRGSKRFSASAPGMHQYSVVFNAASGSQSICSVYVMVPGKVSTPVVEPSRTWTSVSDNNIGTFTVEFEVTATDDVNAYIPNTSRANTNGEDGGFGARYAIYGDTFHGNSSSVLTSSANMSGNYFVVPKGETEAFRLTVSLDPDTAGSYAVGLTQVGYAESAKSPDKAVDIKPSDRGFRTDTVTISNATASSSAATYRGYINGVLFVETKNLTKETALANCKKSAAAKPNDIFRCTWNGEDIFRTVRPSNEVTFALRVPNPLKIGSTYDLSWSNGTRGTIAERLRSFPDVIGEIIAHNQDRSLGVGQTVAARMTKQDIERGHIAWTVRDRTNDGRVMPAGNYDFWMVLSVPTDEHNDSFSVIAQAVTGNVAIQTASTPITPTTKLKKDPPVLPRPTTPLPAPAQTAAPAQYTAPAPYVPSVTAPVQTTPTYTPSDTTYPQLRTQNSLEASALSGAEQAGPGVIERIKNFFQRLTGE